MITCYYFSQAQLGSNYYRLMLNSSFKMKVDRAQDRCQDLHCTKKQFCNPQVSNSISCYY